jgi:zinc finger CCHC domain-containing protein 9
MTRVTNFGRKRTYVAAGFASEPQESIPQESHNAVDIGDKQETNQPPPKKKRKRTKMSKRDGNAAGELSTEGAAVVREPANGGEGEAKEVGPSKTTPGKTAKKNKEKRQKCTQSITYPITSSDGRG